MITTEEFMDIIALHRQGLSMRTICQETWECPPEHCQKVHRRRHHAWIWAAFRRPSILDPYRQWIDDLSGRG
ncbi:MAG: hypothetical protein AB7U29_10840 [Desulfobulbus sp.]